MADETGEALAALVTIEGPVNSFRQFLKLQQHLAGNVDQKKSDLP